MPSQKYTMAPEIWGHAKRIAEHYDLYDEGDLLDRGHDDDVERRGQALARLHRPGRPDHRQVHRHGHGAAEPSEAAWRPRARHLRRAHVPHRPVGLRLHRRQLRGRSDDEARRQARRHHRHRGDRRAVHPAARARRQGAVRLPAHAVVDRRPQQPPDRPGLVRHPAAWLAARVADELRHAADRRLRRRGPRQGRLDRHLPAHPRPDDGPARRRPVEDDRRLVPAGVPRQRRREDGGDPRRVPTRSSTTRRRPRT